MAENLLLSEVTFLSKWFWWWTSDTLAFDKASLLVDLLNLDTVRWHLWTSFHGTWLADATNSTSMACYPFNTVSAFLVALSMLASFTFTADSASVFVVSLDASEEAASWAWSFNAFSAQAFNWASTDNDLLVTISANNSAWASTWFATFAFA